mgnify:CR=1 FL=1
MIGAPQVQRLSIEGSVILKRKSVWVKRYAVIENCIFTYRKAQNDRTNKVKIDLRKAKVMLGQRENSAPYIYIQEDPLKAEAIRVSFDAEAEFNKWLEVVQ